MHPRQASLQAQAQNVLDKIAKKKLGAPLLWKYFDKDTGKDFYLPERKMTGIKSPWSGKTISMVPEKFTMGDVGKELKEDGAAAKTDKSKKAALLETLKNG